MNERAASPSGARASASSRTRRVVVGAVVVLCALAFGLALAEGIVRVVRPQWKDTIENSWTAHRLRRYASAPDTCWMAEHPDTGAYHRSVRNSLGLRQNREFDLTRSDVFRVGLFGDSMAENELLPLPCSLSEPLDYLLNRAGRPADVLNAGVAGYGTDQSYLAYAELAAKTRFDAVIYLYSDNDPTEVFSHGLTRVGPDGVVTFELPRPSGPVRRVLSRLYLTYLVLEGLRILDPKAQTVDWIGWLAGPGAAGPGDRTPKRLHGEKFEFKHIPGALDVVAILAQMATDVRAAGGRFYVVLTPFLDEDFRADPAAALATGRNAELAAMLAARGIEVVDLLPVFVEFERATGRRTYLVRDRHWNEEGNRLAAVEAFRRIAADQGLPADDGLIRDALRAYYNALGIAATGRVGVDRAPVDEREQAAIRARYLALDPRWDARNCD